MLNYCVTAIIQFVDHIEPNLSSDNVNKVAMLFAAFDDKLISHSLHETMR